jgi:hypothetical protein
MSRLRLRLKYGTILGGGGGGGSTTYNTAFGITDTTTGWTSFPLHASAKRIWVDSVNGSDSNNGLSAATAKATMGAAKTLYLGAGFTSGDQIMVAGGQGQTYTDTWTVSYLSGKGGVSLLNPIAELSYDSADPTNTALYGKLTGAKQPVISVNGTSGGFHWFGDSGATGSQFMAISGIAFDGMGLDNGNTSVTFSGSNHAGIIIQNCRFNGIELAINIGNDQPAASGGTFGANVRVTRCSFNGQWATNGNASGLYLEATTGAVIEDCVFIHCGWKMGADRTDAVTDGGAYYLGHGHYISPMNVGTIARRNFYATNAQDGFNARGPTKGDCIASMWEPWHGHLGGFSGGVADDPLGSLNQVDDWAAIGSAKAITTGYVGKGVFRALCTNNGSYVRNLVAGDSPYRNDSDSFFFSMGWDDPAAVDTYMLLDHCIGYNWSTVAMIPAGDSSFGTHIHPTATNSLFDISYQGNGISSAGALPGAITAAQLVTTMGFANAPAMFNAMLYRPDLPWGQAVTTVWLTAYGKTLTNTPACAVPSIGSDTPTVIFGSSAGTLTLSDSTFAHASAKTVNILGCPAGWSIVGNSLPTGFTVKSAARQLVYDGTGTAGLKSISLTNSLENVGTHTDVLTATVS